MDQAEFDGFIGHRLEHDAELAGLLARLGPRRGWSGGDTYTGDDVVAPLGVAVTRPVRAHVSLELTGATAYRQACRLAQASLPPGSYDPQAQPALPGDPDPLELAAARLPLEAWEPILDVLHEGTDGWVRSRPIGTRGAPAALVLGYQGWWRFEDEPGHTDTRVQVLARARHARGLLVWVASRTNLVTPGDEHKRVLVAILEVDD